MGTADEGTVLSSVGMVSTVDVYSVALRTAAELSGAIVEDAELYSETLCVDVCAAAVAYTVVVVMPHVDPEVEHLPPVERVTGRHLS